MYLLLAEVLTKALTILPREKRRLYKFSLLVIGCDHYNPHLPLPLVKMWNMPSPSRIGSIPLTVSPRCIVG